MADASANPTQDVISVSRLQQAYQRKFDKLSALAAEELTTINLDIPSVYTLGSGALLKMRPYRDQILALPHLNKELVEGAEDYLLALGHAQALHLAASTPVASLPELYAQLLKLREILLADSTALEKRGLIPSERLKELRGPTSHSATAFDVLALATILRAHWTGIAGKTALQLSDLEQAETLADRLLGAVGERAVSDQEASSAVLNRQRAFTLFVRAYEELRRALVYLRWHEDDVDELAPSLYSYRVGRRRRSESNGETTENDASVESALAARPAAGKAAANAPVGAEDSPFVS